MNESQAILPPVTESDPTLVLAGTDKIATPAPHTLSSPAPPSSRALEIFTTIRHTIKAQTHLSDTDIALAAFWVISSWFQEALVVLPCLVIAGPAHEATELLRVLHDLCYAPLLLAGFRRGDLRDVTGHTLLISEPNLNKQTAALLGNLTNRGFMVVEQRSYLRCYSSKAIYVGEDPTIRRIQHAIYIDGMQAPNAGAGSLPEWVRRNIEHLPGHLDKYRESNLAQVCRLEFNPSGVSAETGAVAKALGSCIVDSPALQAALLSILAPRDQQHISERQDTAEALVVEAVLALGRGGAEQLYAREIAVEVRGERFKLSPEKVGHRLRKLGLPTRRLSQLGNGLVIDKETVARLQTLAGMYVGEDRLSNIENLHCSQTKETKAVEEDMEDMEV